MRSSSSKWIIIAVVVLVLFALGIIIFLFLQKDYVPGPDSGEGAELLPKDSASLAQNKFTKTIGLSVEGRPIESYMFGSGATHIAFVGGIHGGYEWNSVVLAYEFLDYLDLNSSTLPMGLTVTVIPSANPDGVFKVTGKEGRFTANGK